MKKFVTLTMLLIAALTTQAQSLIGRWKYPLQVQGEKVSLIMGFNADKTATYELQTTNTSEELGALTFSFIVKGTYVVDGKDLTVNLDNTDCEIDFVEIQWSEALKASFKENPEREKTIINNMRGAMENGKAKFLKTVEKVNEFNIDKITYTTLELSDDDSAISSYKVNCVISVPLREPLGTGTCFTLHNLGRSDYGIRCITSDNIRA